MGALLSGVNRLDGDSKPNLAEEDSNMAKKSSSELLLLADLGIFRDTLLVSATAEVFHAVWQNCIKSVAFDSLMKSSPPSLGSFPCMAKSSFSNTATSFAEIIACSFVSLFACLGVNDGVSSGRSNSLVLIPN